MTAQFTGLDWAIVGGYVVVLALAGYLSSRRQSRSSADYFLAGGRTPVWLVAVSVLSTTQSAATFLGAPDYGYRGDFAYVTSFAGSLLAAFVVARVLIPRFYAAGVTTVYELLEHRFDRRAMRAAGAMYLVGRVLAGGSRLYLAAIAVSMITFLSISPASVLLSAAALVALGLMFTLVGGLRSVIWSDLVQVVIYVGAALVVLIVLRTSIPASTAEIVAGLQNAPGGLDKLTFFDTSADLGRPFTLLAIFTGVVLLNIGNSGLDQDTTQRLLACRDSSDGARALYVSVLAAVPVVFLFITIGALLHIFYDRPELMARGAATAVAKEFEGEKITIFMHYILSQLPTGLRGFVAVGVIAAAAVNSGLISMSSVVVQDFYRPWASRRRTRPESHFVLAARISMVVLGLALLAMAFLCYFWQRYADTPLLEFVLSVMAFAYSGLLGVYATAVFTRRGSYRSIVGALVVGFCVILVQQSYIVDVTGLPSSWKSLAFPWQLCIATAAAFMVCVADRGGAALPKSNQSIRS